MRGTAIRHFVTILLCGIVIFGFAQSRANPLQAEPTSAKEAAAQNLSGLVYHPEGDAIAICNGTRRDNRPLYCNQRQMVILAGEMPGVSSPLGNLRVGIQRGDVRVQLDQFHERVARYRPGRMEWEVTDPRLPGLAVTMTAVTIAAGDGFAARVESKDAKAGDELQWIVTNVPPVKITGGFKVGLGIVSMSGDAFVVPLADNAPQDFAMVGGSKAVPATRAFEDGLARVGKLGRQVVVDTPDPYFNAGVGASCAAMYGLYVGKVFVHGGSRWRAPYLGWRVMDGATAYGWHELVMADAEARSRDQVKQPNGKTTAEADSFGAEQSQNSRFYGLGKIMSTGTRYDMQTQFFDQCCREWRATGDAVFAKRLLPMLELHLQWAKECFDPDDDGLYESYINTWPTDSQWYNGGGTVEESAYIYYQRRAAADLCRLAGRAGDAIRHDAEARKIHAALDRELWVREKGQYAAYVDQGGLKRVHDDAWVYSEHLPIEAGMASPMQAWQAMYYTDWAMEKFKFPFGGEMRQTSNWAPGQWSVRELYHGDNFAMALGYFLAGQGDEGWDLLRGTMLESMYGDQTAKSGYGNGMVNEISPGGLSHPKCSIDFNDITSMFCRSVVEGLFGYRPDYPNRVVTIGPSLPSAWEHASIRTPDYSLSFKRDTDADCYILGLTRPAKMSLRLPVLAETVKAVTVNSAEVKWTIEPWVGYGMLVVELPETARAEVAVVLGKRAAPAPAIVIEKKIGEASSIANAVDPQGGLGAEAKPGHHMAFARVERGNVPYLRPYKVNIRDPEGEARRAAKSLARAPADAKWVEIPLDGVFNGDIRKIFQQKYALPRPATVSCRMGYDGWSAWTFQPWKVGVPTIQLDKPGEPLTTSQGVRFGRIGAERNIVFTSRWDNWPNSVALPVNRAGEAVWLLVCGSTNPMQGRIANAVLRFRYADGQEETLELVPPLNFWSLCPFARQDYDYKRDGFALGTEPPLQVQLGTNCRAMVYGWKLRPGVELKEVGLETLSQEVVIGLMGISIMNPE
jgi:hypothetical protein